MPKTNASPLPEPPPYQFMPPPLEYAALKADIAVRGIQVPVEFDENGNVLDGHTRLQIAKELGLTSFPRVVRAGLSEVEKQEHALALNLSRRHLTRDQRREVVVTLRGRGWSSRRIAAVTGISAPTVLRDLRAAGVSDVATDHPTEVQGTDGKTYRARRKTSVVVSTDHQQRLAQEALHALGDEAPGRMTDLRRLERLRRDQRARLAREQSRSEAAPLPDGMDLRHCRFEDLDIGPGVAGAVITDPPYDRRAMQDGTWDRLGGFCTRVLRPGGLLVAYAPTMWLPDALDALRKSGLDYHWQFVVTFPQHPYQVRARGLASAYRPVLVFRQPGAETNPPWSLDVFTGGGRSKDTDHPWEQAADEVHALIQTLTTPGDLIVDPFLGSGTTAVAVQRVGGRRFVGCDIEEDWVDLAKSRVSTAADG